MAAPLRSVVPDHRADERVILHGVPWWQYEALLGSRGERSVPRLTYSKGTLEIMSPSIDHEELKSRLGRLLELAAFLQGARLTPFGSWTIRRPELQRGLEPDECYVVTTVRRSGPRPTRPDLAIEIAWTSGGVEKLGIYAELAVPEVWVWEDGALTVHVLDGNGYRPAPSSGLLPWMDIALLADLIAEDDEADALERLRTALR